LELVAPRRYRSSYSIDFTEEELDAAEVTAITYVTNEPNKYYKRLHLYYSATLGYPDSNEPGLAKAVCRLSTFHRRFIFKNVGDAVTFFVWASTNVKGISFQLQGRHVRNSLKRGI
jgi:hypothetical protein